MNEKRIDETVRLGTTEIREIENASMMPQSFHIHDVQFRILTRNGVVADPVEAGLKDTFVSFRTNGCAFFLSLPIMPMRIRPTCTIATPWNTKTPA